ncbi:MAG: hypothetical protein AAF355_15770 [Myxococcota bacterium]
MEATVDASDAREPVRVFACPFAHQGVLVAWDMELHTVQPGLALLTDAVSTVRLQLFYPNQTTVVRVQTLDRATDGHQGAHLFHLVSLPAYAVAAFGVSNSAEFLSLAHTKVLWHEAEHSTA